MTDIDSALIGKALAAATVDQLREEVRRRGLEIHSTQFSEAAKQAVRELDRLRTGAGGPSK